ncbi:ATP-binding protein [Methanothermobacter defluvii]|nr:ATP-binding protein [Methanothermobacter defluvii]
MMVLVSTKMGAKILSRVAKITPFNAYYTEDDPWSEARRKGLHIPDNIARKYEICELDLLIQLPNSEVNYPPKPGDEVLKIDLESHYEDIFGISRDEPGYVWFGSLFGYKNAPIPLDIEKVPMHMAVFGTTGSGKSFSTGVLIEKFMCISAGENRAVSFPMIIIDANGDYLEYDKYFKQAYQDIDSKIRPVGWVKRFVFPHIAYQNSELRGEPVIGVDLDRLSVKEIAETIVMYHKGSLDGAELQISGIVTLLDYLRENEGYDSLHEFFVDDDLYDELIGKLRNFDTKRIAAATKPAIERAFAKFREIESNYKILSAKKESELTQDEFIDDITENGGIAIIDFSEEGATGVDIQVKQLVMTYLANLLFNKFSKYKIENRTRYLIFLIEEAQNFIPDKSYPISSSLAKNKLSLIATQGRKFGLSLCIVTQRPSFIDKIVLSMCNTFFIHRISPDDVSYVRTATGGLPSSLETRLTRLTQGHMIVTGQMNKLPFPLMISIPKADRIVPHPMGTTDVISTLKKLREGFDYI